MVFFNENVILINSKTLKKIITKKFLKQNWMFFHFRCFLPHEDICVLCGVQRKQEMFFFFWVDIFLLSVLFIISIYNWLLIRSSSGLEMCCYFEKMMETCNLAFEAAQNCKESQKRRGLDKFSKWLRRQANVELVFLDANFLNNPYVKKFLKQQTMWTCWTKSTKFAFLFCSVMM